MKYGDLIKRDPRILFDQMVAYYVRKGYSVPISSQKFQIGLSQRFIERDGMFFRLEAFRVGFKKAWQKRNYAVIVAVADKIPNNVLEEDPKLLMWYDQAVTRMGGK